MYIGDNDERKYLLELKPLTKKFKIEMRDVFVFFKMYFKYFTPIKKSMYLLSI